LRPGKEKTEQEMKVTPVTDQNYAWGETQGIIEGSVENLLIAEAELIKYRDLNLSHKNQLQLINVGILLSLTYMKQNKLDECRSKMEEKIAIAKPGEIIMPFIEPGKQMVDCLKLLPVDTLKSDFVKRIFNLLA
jgi:hypothetical protein